MRLRLQMLTVQLEKADILKCSRVRGPLQERSEPLAAVDVAPLRMRSKLARVHVLDHALAQRANRHRSHGETPVLSEVATPRSSGQRSRIVRDDLLAGSPG